MSERATTKAVDKWWEADHHTAGGGLGIVLHEKRGNRWLVGDVLRRSPAEKAGVLPGDYVLQIDDYELSGPDADISEPIGLVRSQKGAVHRLVLQRPSGHVDARVVSGPMRSLLRVATQAGQPLRPGPGGGGGGCGTCRRCTPTGWGWLDCGTGRRCQQRCAIV
jgi:hypothetical protein